MAAIEAVERALKAQPRTWLITGVAGFVGSNLLERLLSLGQQVVGLDNFLTGHRSNLDDVLAQFGASARFRLVEGDIRDLDRCRTACEGVDYVLHEAALGSVPRSIGDPIASHQVNVDGSLNMLVAARDAKVKRFVYASSSSVYGDHPALPKVEENIGKPLSPYAATKRVNELYAQVFGDVYGMEIVGLRYFNVFGRRQDPNGPYAAVIPKWIAQLLSGERGVIHGDGETSRDFCFVDNVVQANLLAAMAPSGSGPIGQVFNIAFGGRTTLTQLYELIRERLARHVDVSTLGAEYRPFRPGDIRHSHANIDKARRLLGYAPKFSVSDGLDQTMEWYVARARSTRS